MKALGVVSDAVAISGRGIALFFSVSPSHLSQMSALEVFVTRPDGTTCSFSASREFARKAGVPGGEVVALLVRGASLSDIPIGSVVGTTSPSGA